MGNKNKITDKYFIYLYFFFITFNLIGQNDSLKIVNTLASIEDSTMSSDSVLVKKASKQFEVYFKSLKVKSTLETFAKSKKQIDKLDYRNSANILYPLPFSSISEFGYVGSPSAINVFSFTNGSVGIISDNSDLTNQWNGNSDLHRIQTEDLSSIKIVSIHKAFMFGFKNYSSIIDFSSVDSLRSKPISRIRYYQASNDEGFIDAFFSAKIIPRLALSFRVTNSAQGTFYKNTEYGNWKVKLKSIYKIADSAFTKVEYDHFKIKTPLNGGVDLSSLISNGITPSIGIFDTQADVVYSDLYNLSSVNIVSAKLYGNILPLGFSDLKILYTNSEDKFKGTFDTLYTKNFNKYDLFSGLFKHNFKISNFFTEFSAGYEKITYDIDAIQNNTSIENYFSALSSTSDWFNSIFTSSMFGKYSFYNEQATLGLGFDLQIKPASWLNFLFGYSNYGKPYDIIEKPFTESSWNQNVNNIFASLEINSCFTQSSFSYFNSDVTNSLLPIYSSNSLSDSQSEIVFKNIGTLTRSGFNINSNTEFWNILLTANLNYYWEDTYLTGKTTLNNNLVAGLYYVDTLYNSNLDLKTGFTFYYWGETNNTVFDFQKMRSTKYFLQAGTLQMFDFYDLNIIPYRLDLFLAGRIQKSATIYFVYENILGHNFYTIPYYPMPDGGMRIGISWDFLD